MIEFGFLDAWRGRLSQFIHYGALFVVLFGMSGCVDLAEQRRRAEMEAAQRTPSGDLIGAERTFETNADSTLIRMARDEDVGYVELVAANPGVDPWLPGDGTVITIPTRHILPAGARSGIVINLAEQRLYYYDHAGAPITFPIGIGRDGFATPLGVTKVVRKAEDPIWYPPRSARRDDPSLGRSVPPGPDNPLGHRALYLGWPQYLIHGTNKPDGIGRLVSRGCIRMYPEDVEALFEWADEGTIVRVIDEPIKVGWARGELYIEVHPTIAQAGQIEEGEGFDPEPDVDVHDLIAAAVGPDIDGVDWQKVDTALAERRGVPIQVTQRFADTPPAGDDVLSRWREELLSTLAID